MEAGDLDLEDTVKEHRRDGGRSGEEIERLTVDENLSDLERTKLFLSPTAHQLQISCALEKLPVIFHEYKEAAHQALFPAFTTCLENFNIQAQVVAGEAMISIMQDTTLPKDVGSWLLPTALSILNCNRHHDVLQVWLKALSAMIPVLPEKMIEDELMQLALAKGESHETMQSRTVCCTILGAIAPLLGQDKIEKRFLNRAMALCQEVVLPELFELLRDEELQVQNAAFVSLMELLNFLPPDARKLKIMPFLCPCAPQLPVFSIASFMALMYILSNLIV